MKITSILGFLVWVGVLGAGGYFFWSIQESHIQERRLREALGRLMERDRVARFLVDRVRKDPETGHRTTHLLWEEERDGHPLPVREIVIRGDDIYFDTVQINFDPRFVREDDPLRGRSLTLLRRIFALEETSEGRLRIPEGGVVNLDLPDEVARSLAGEGRPVDGGGKPPQAYRGALSDDERLERRLWSEIWELFTDPRVARAEGVVTAQKKAVGKPLVEGMEYTLRLSRTGQLDLEGPRKPDPITTFKRKE